MTDFSGRTESSEVIKYWQRENLRHIKKLTSLRR
jgi:hypothetical protein